MTITINCDMGESFGIYTLGDDEACMPFVTHANIACGFHASDPQVMWRTVRLAKKYGLDIGAHPGFPDREGFGRREIKLGRDETAAMVIYQVGALKGFLDSEHTPLSHIKPHGSLFGMAMKDEGMAHGIADAAEVFGVPVIGFSNCVMEDVYRERNIPYFCEFYFDLDYDDRGWQIITVEHVPVAPDVAVARVLRAVNEGKVLSVNNKEVEVRADSICVHSDTPGAAAIAEAVHNALKSRLPRQADEDSAG
ncbi:MAG: 5-oxoprolinase subunit PxpA [Paracoccaceae bacterium]|nr:5-oxoprolinase subunit PxpA [Paracoccaceae bacterium]MDE2913854.1 5-oxoprolinase subunit PxpA [Paracoccaceae bacterium]